MFYENPGALVDKKSMLDLIREGVMFNFEIVYNSQLGYPWNVMRDLMADKKSDFSSYWAQREQNYMKNLDKIVSNFD